MVVEAVNRGAKTMKYPKVSIIIVNWNGKEHLSKCLPSIFDNTTYPNYEIILVDNGSTDSSVEFIRENYPNPNVKIIKLDKNYGFVKGSNIGMIEAYKDKDIKYIARLDNDTEVDRNWLTELVKVAESDEKIGLCGSKIFFMDNPAIIYSTGSIIKLGMMIDRGHGKIDKGQYDDKLNIFCASAAACLLKREMAEELGLFEEQIFAGYDEGYSYKGSTPLPWAYKFGWKARYVPTSVVYHKAGGTRKRDSELERKEAILAAMDGARAFKEYATPLQKLMFLLVLIKTAIMSWAGMRIGRNILGAKPYIEALKEFFRYRTTEKKK